ncbi:hypothetical protein AC1031_017069 [Aphanomyces cochlioides]|nr:hypothetical protein AC1031_017069 [Aphanomyces cochlioides]
METTSTAPAKGRVFGQSNFRTEEDELLASAYVKSQLTHLLELIKAVTHFGQKSPNSLANRFNNVLQKDVSKFVGLLSQSLREFHSGWQMQDYVNDAKRKYRETKNTVFKHEGVYKILCCLPKFEVSRSVIASQVRQALDLDSSESLAEAENVIQIAKRPTIGKKKSKRMKIAVEESSSRAVQLARLADASEKKNEMLHEHIIMELFKLDPNSDESRRYFSLKRKQFIDQAEKLVQQRNDSDIEDVV